MKSKILLNFLFCIVVLGLGALLGTLGAFIIKLF